MTFEQRRLEGIIQEDGTVLGEDGRIYYLPRRGSDGEFPKVLMEAEKFGGSGCFSRQSIKPFIGYKVGFYVNVIDGRYGRGFDYEIIGKPPSEEKESS